VQIRKTLHEDIFDFATSLDNLGVLYYFIGQYQKAEPLYKQVLNIRKGVQGDHHPDYGTSVNNLAALYYSMGQYQKAEPLYQEALQVTKARLGQDHPDYADTLNNLAMLYYSMAQYGKAEPLFRQALEIYKRLGQNRPSYTHTLNNLALLYESLGRYQEAEPLFRRALDIRSRVLGSDHPYYAESLNNLALLYNSIGQYKKAEPLLRQALEITRRLGQDHPWYATSLTNLAVLSEATGRHTQALEAFDHAMQIQQANIDAVFSFTSEPAMRDFVNTTRASLDALISLGLLEGAQDPAVNQAAARWTLRRKAVVFDALSRFQQAQRLQASDPAVAQNAVRVRELKQRLHNLTLNPPKAVDSAALQRERDAAQGELDRVQADLNKILSATTPTVQVEINSMQQQLSRGAALLEVLRSRIYGFKATGTTQRWKSAHYVAVVIRRGVRPWLIDLGEADEIDKQVKDVRQPVEDFAKLPTNAWIEQEKSAEDEFKAASSVLYHAIFTPQLKQALGNAKTIYVAPDGELNQIAFESLVDEQHRYLIESHSFVYLTTGRDLLRPHTSMGKGTVVFAAPDYNLGVKERRAEAAVLMEGAQNNARAGVRGAASRDIRGGSWKPLAGAPLEAKDVRELLGNSKFGPVTTYEDKQALEEVFLSLHSPRVLHVATHGYFLPDQKLDPADREMMGDSSVETGAARGLGRLRGTEDPLLRSGLVFAGANLVGSPDASSAQVGDGWVTAEEVSLMDLRGTELVVLSACESGLGQMKAGDGVQGLRRAFVLAGARSLVTSLYKVPDAESQRLMRQFYQGLLKSGGDKALALHEAQLEMIRERRKNSGAAHPFFWASFIFLGDPN